MLVQSGFIKNIDNVDNIFAVFIGIGNGRIISLYILGPIIDEVVRCFIWFRFRYGIGWLCIGCRQNFDPSFSWNFTGRTSRLLGKLIKIVNSC